VTRFLFVVPPLIGHVNPLVGVAAGLAERGHDVAWAGAEHVVRPLTGGQWRVFPCLGGLWDGPERPPESRGFTALKFLWEQFLVPVAEAMLPGVRAAVEEFAPEVLVVDQQAFAGGIVAEEWGLPWATSATTSSELVDPLAGVPKVADWVGERMWELQRAFSSEYRDLRFSPHLVLAFTTEAMVGPVEHLAGRCHFVGPSIGDRASGDGFPWHALDPARPTVLVTLGTANADVSGGFLAECVRALTPMSAELQAVIVDPAGVVGTTPPHVVVRPHVPQVPLLACTRAVVCHAGHNTTCEALAHGIPLAVAPIRDDQPIVAQQVVDAGAGIRLRFNRVSEVRIRESIRDLLSDPSYRDAARTIQRSFDAAGGSVAAAGHLERLAGPAR
jgi:MGT family glycosyltransferase